jgi:hypothetical protein
VVRKRTTNLDMSELGATGTSINDGIISSDDNALFNYLPEALRLYRNIRNDSTAKACLLCKELPIRSAKWWVQPASESEEDIQTAAFIEEALMRRMSITWDRFLREVCLKFAFGFVVHEKVFKEEDGKIWLKKLAVRLPETLDRWEFDENGGPRAFNQLTYDAKGKSVKARLPIEKIIIWTNRQEGSNLNGRSDLREVYRPWFAKDRLMRLQLIESARATIFIEFPAV